MPKLPTNTLIIQYTIPTGTMKGKLRQITYKAMFRTTSSIISFPDKALEGEPDARVARKSLIIDTTASKKDFLYFVKGYFSRKFGVPTWTIKLRWENWVPLWGEPWQ